MITPPTNIINMFASLVTTAKDLSLHTQTRFYCFFNHRCHHPCPYKHRSKTVQLLSLRSKNVTKSICWSARQPSHHSAGLTLNFFPPLQGQRSFGFGFLFLRFPRLEPSPSLKSIILPRWQYTNDSWERNTIFPGRILRQWHVKAIQQKLKGGKKVQKDHPNSYIATSQSLDHE
jgi:hypothetical protein